jgi:hypothetical protein
MQPAAARQAHGLAGGRFSPADKTPRSVMYSIRSWVGVVAEQARERRLAGGLLLR